MRLVSLECTSSACRREKMNKCSILCCCFLSASFSLVIFCICFYSCFAFAFGAAKNTSKYLSFLGNILLRPDDDGFVCILYVSVISRNGLGRFSSVGTQIKGSRGALSMQHCYEARGHWPLTTKRKKAYLALMHFVYEKSQIHWQLKELWRFKSSDIDNF